jgi:hypothetical protein
VSFLTLKRVKQMSAEKFSAACSKGELSCHA